MCAKLQTIVSAEYDVHLTHDYKSSVDGDGNLLKMLDVWLQWNAKKEGINSLHKNRSMAVAPLGIDDK